MSIEPKELIKIKAAFEKNGIVTKNDSSVLDSRPMSREVWNELLKLGYETSVCEEFALPGYSSYSNVIYDSNRYLHSEAGEYMKTYVL